MPTLLSKLLFGFYVFSSATFGAFASKGLLIPPNAKLDADFAPADKYDFVIYGLQADLTNAPKASKSSQLILENSKQIYGIFADSEQTALTNFHDERSQGYATKLEQGIENLNTKDADAFYVDGEKSLFRLSDNGPSLLTYELQNKGYIGENVVITILGDHKDPLVQATKEDAESNGFRTTIIPSVKTRGIEIETLGARKTKKELRDDLRKLQEHKDTLFKLYGVDKFEDVVGIIEKQKEDLRNCALESTALDAGVDQNKKEIERFKADKANLEKELTDIQDDVKRMEKAEQERRMTDAKTKLQKHTTTRGALEILRINTKKLEDLKEQAQKVVPVNPKEQQELDGIIANLERQISDSTKQTESQRKQQEAEEQKGAQLRQDNIELGKDVADLKAELNKLFADIAEIASDKKQ